MSSWWSGLSSEEWRIAVGLWFIIDASCVVNLCSWVFIAMRWMVTNRSSLEVVHGLLYQLMCKRTFNTLFWIKVIWSTICIFWYFLSVINLNNQCSNDTLLGTKIRTSDLQDRVRARYQLSLSFNHSVHLFNGHSIRWNVRTIHSISGHSII